MSNNTVEIRTENGMLLMEVDNPKGIKNLGALPPKHMRGEFAGVVDLAESGIKQFSRLEADEVELEFGLTGSLETGDLMWKIVKASGEVSLSVKLKWTRQKGGA